MCVRSLVSVSLLVTTSQTGPGAAHPSVIRGFEMSSLTEGELQVELREVTGTRYRPQAISI